MAIPVESLTPREIVARLDEYIIGQTAAKKAVAVALRNRYRRMSLPEEERADVLPKNILMIGPTGVGKTEIARRLANLAQAPFVKVEATKFTEVGYVGRDVDSIVRDLAANAVRLVETEMMAGVQEEAGRRAVDRLVELLQPGGGYELYGHYNEQGNYVEPEPVSTETFDAEELRRSILAGEKDDELVSVTSEEPNMPFVQMFSNQGIEEMGIESAHPAFGTKFVERRLTVREAKDLLKQQEADKMVDRASIYRAAVERAEQTGIVFIDEIDKVAIKSGGGSGPDISREGVQRDLLPVIEGSTVQTKYGPVRTEHILFVCAGAFHLAKPSDLIPELQGRLPIRVELEPLALGDFRRILREPKNALTRQYQSLLAVDGVTIQFTEDALDEIASFATAVNERTENIGARRLHTIMERLLEDLLFEAPEGISGQVTFDAAKVRERLESVVANPTKSRGLPSNPHGKPPTMASGYLGLLVLIGFAAIVSGAMVTLSWVLGPKKKTPYKAAPYECGVTPVGDTHQRFPVKFYLVGIIFILFDIEAVFLWSWYTVYRNGSLDFMIFSFVSFLSYMASWILGYVYAIRVGAIDWDEATSPAPEKFAAPERPTVIGESVAAAPASGVRA